MKTGIIYLLIWMSFSVSVQAQKESDQFEVERGTNIAHWLSQSNRRGEAREAFIKESDIKKIASMGFDHIRLPIDEDQMWDENGNRHEEAFQLMTRCIDWAAENNLKVIVDLHILRSHHFNEGEKPLWTDPAAQEKFSDLWRDLSEALKGYPDSMVAYELMNEPVAEDPEDWNNLVRRLVATIRENEPNRTVVMGSNRWQSVNTFDDLYVPENDKNILLSFHYYEPFLLTHWNASWTNLKNYTGPVHYPGVLLTAEEYGQLPDEVQPEVERFKGKVFNKEVIQEHWEKAIKKAQDYGLNLYCGEFGVVQKAPRDDRIRWYRDMIELFEKNGIGYANWNYKSDNFGLVDGQGQPDQELIEIVTGK